MIDAGHEVSLITGQYCGWSNNFDRIWTDARLMRHIAVPFGPGTPTPRRLAQVITRIGARNILQLTTFHSVTAAHLAHHDVTPGLIAAAKRTPAKLYIAHYVAALPAAAAAARRHNALYAYDAEDFHLGDWPEDPQYDLERWLVRCIEGSYLPSCTYVTAASPMIADALAQAYGIKRPQVVLNVFPRIQAPASATPKGTAEPGPSLYWFSQTIGAERGLECAVRAIGLSAHRPHLYLRGHPAAGYVEQLERLAVETGAEGRMHILPPAEPNQMEKLAVDYDLGLASEIRASRNREICLTNKLFSFLLAGLPPLMSATAAQTQFAEEADLADLIYPIDDSTALAALIDRLLGNPARLAALRKHVWRLGQERFNWERECKKVKRLAEQVLAGR